MRAGDARSIAEYFGSYVVPVDDPSQDVKIVRSQVTGMPAIAVGPQFGNAFAYCDQI